MTQFTCSRHSILIHEKITTYLNEKGTSRKNCFICEQLIQANTRCFTRGRLYERVKLFSIQRKIGDLHKAFYIQQIVKLAYYRSYYEILGKHHVAEVRHKAFESTPDNIITCLDYAKQFSFEPSSQLQNELFDKNCTLSMEG